MTAPVAPGLRVSGPDVPPTYVPLPDAPLIVLVGVTGVGKSTALAALNLTANALLPDRRALTDAVVLRGEPVTDREERFRRTAAYRRAHAGGMAQALASLALDPAVWPLGGAPLVFDGLRGAEEVKFAAERLPRARFVALHAPDLVRVRRLLGRADAFDAVRAAQTNDLLASLREVDGVSAVFGEADLEAVAALAREGHAPGDVLAKTRIVVAERRHYDPDAALALLRELPPERALALDTLDLSPAEVAARIGAWR